VLSVGDRAPEATVFLGPHEPVTIAELVEDGPKLLFFFPFAWSSTCTNEMELLRDRKSEFDALGVQPIGVSRDSPWTHIAWRQVLDLNFGLLSDWNAEAVNGFGIAYTYRGFNEVAERSAFLIDEQGTIRGAWKYDSGEVPDVDELLAACRTDLHPSDQPA
jgi:glutaredoxin-dependent peroxiredoxin